MSFLYSFMSLVLVIFVLVVPVIITILLLKHFNKHPKTDQDYLLEKIRELENRIENLEDNFS
ncbi:MAG: hypothetical protein ACOCG5_11525 [Candidatus Alkaliphilus sp. MAG34]|mgnify:CR=1 FL=1|nr:hypothetical protein [Clostridiales bacterium]